MKEEKLFTAYEESDELNKKSNTSTVPSTSKNDAAKSPEEYMQRMIRSGQEKNYANYKFEGWK